MHQKEAFDLTSFGTFPAFHGGMDVAKGLYNKAKKGKGKPLGRLGASLAGGLGTHAGVGAASNAIAGAAGIEGATLGAGLLGAAGLTIPGAALVAAPLGAATYFGGKKIGDKLTPKPPPSGADQLKNSLKNNAGPLAATAGTVGAGLYGLNKWRKKRKEKKKEKAASVLGGFGGFEAGKGLYEKLTGNKGQSLGKTYAGVGGGIAGTAGTVAAAEGLGGLAAGTALAPIAPHIGIPLGLASAVGGFKLKNKLSPKKTPKPPQSNFLKDNAAPLALGGTAGLYGLKKFKDSRNKKKKEKQKEATIMNQEDILVDGLNKIAHVIGEQPQTIYAMLEAGAQEMTKEASVENIYVDGINKVARATGLEPEVLDEGIAMFFEKKANAKVEAQSDADEAKSQQVNNDLNKIAAYIQNMSEEEAKELLEGGE